MRILQTAKDGGPKSPVDAFFLIECKWLFSIALLRFNKGGRKEYHTHAFNALTWFICGDMVEESFDGSFYVYRPSLIPKLTKRSKNHRVFSNRTSWCFTIRGPWAKTWTEHTENGDLTIFGHGRKKLNSDIPNGQS